VQYIENTIVVEDLKKVFVKPEHRTILTEAFNLTKHGFYSEHMTHSCSITNELFGKVHLSFATSNAAFLMPNYASKPIDDADVESMGRINNYLVQYYEIAKHYEDALKVLEWLNDNCSTPMQAKFLWPGILTLYKLVEHERLDELRLSKIPNKLPALPLGFREVAQSTAGVLAAASLLDAPPAKKSEVSVPHVTFKFPPPC
jgi:hypothetical protein